MARAKYDPLEAAKIRAEKAEEKAEKMERAASPKPEVTPPPPAPAPSPAPAVTAPASPAPAPVKGRRGTRYRVVVSGRISIDGQLCTMPKGAIIDAAGYGGEAGIQRLMAQGLKLEQEQS